MEAGQARSESCEAAEVRNPDGKAIGDGSAAGSGLLDCVDGGGGDDFRVCGNGEEVLELGETRIVESEMVVSVESSVVEMSGFGVGGTEIGASVGESGAGEIVKEIEVVSGSEEVQEASDEGGGEIVKEVDVVSGSEIVKEFDIVSCSEEVEEASEEVEEASDEVSGDSRAVGDSAEGDGVVESEDMKMMETEEDPEGGGVFFVGDFVWGKIKNHPWWPGQIYDPSNASDSATKHNHKGRFLVAFSDGSFAWCHSAQLKPFEDGFDEMLKQCNSKSFVSAVDNALNDIGRLVELEMTCPCVLKGNEEELDRPLADNTGIKEGVFIPERGSNCSITEFEPVEFIEKLKNVAHDASVANMIDVLMLKSMMCAFYRAKDGYELPEYYEPQQIPGLEDKMEEGALDTVVHEGAVEVQVQGPFEEALGYSESSLTCSPNFPGSRENQFHRRKQKSIAEIIAKEGSISISDKLASKSGMKKRKASSEAYDDIYSDDTSVSIPMNESEDSEPLATLMSKVVSANDGNGSESGAKKRGRKKKRDSISSVEVKAVAENGHAKTEKKVNAAKSKEQNEKGYASRERKKSKYLCPPYTNPIHPHKKEEPETESKQDASVAQVGKRMKSTASNTLEFPIVKCSSEVTHTNPSEELGMEHDSLNSSSPDRIIVEMPVNDVLSEIRSVALFALRLEETDIDRVAEFLYVYRSSIYLEGPNYQVYEQQQQQQQQKQLGEATKCVSSQKRRGRKRKSINSESMLLSERLNQNGHIDPQSKSRERKKRKNETPKSRHDVVTPDSEANPESPGSASLFVTFGPGSSLPTKSELIALYKKFGDLVENETDMFYNSFCARVVFTRASDAEKAFNSSQESSPFGTANVTFRLRNTVAASKTQSLNETTPKRIKTSTKPPAEEESNGWASQQSFIKEKLEMMTEMVERSDGKMSPSLKSTLEGEMRGLLEKMNTIG